MGERRGCGWAMAALAAAALTAATPARAGDIAWRGLLDVVATERGPAYTTNILTKHDSPFDAYRARLFAEAHAGEKLDVFTEIVLDDASALYVYGAYLQF